MKYILLILAFCSIYQCADPTVEFVMTFFRHGDRTPLHVPSIGYNYIWDISPGYLTPKGLDQAYKLGTELGRVYLGENKLLSENFDDAIQQIYVASSDYERTLRTTSSVLHGIFQNKIKTSYLPILINSKTLKNDLMLNAIKNCQNVKDYLRQLSLQSTRFNDLAKNETTIKLSQKISSIFGYSQQAELINWYDKIYDPLFCAKQHNYMKILSGISDSEIDQAIEIGNQMRDIIFTENEGKHFLFSHITTKITPYKNIQRLSFSNCIDEHL